VPAEITESIVHKKEWQMRKAKMSYFTITYISIPKSCWDAGEELEGQRGGSVKNRARQGRREERNNREERRSESWPDGRVLGSDLLHNSERTVQISCITLSERFRSPA
jgi:hypothetical protein